MVYNKITNEKKKNYNLRLGKKKKMVSKLLTTNKNTEKKNLQLQNKNDKYTTL